MRVWCFSLYFLINWISIALLVWQNKTFITFLSVLFQTTARLLFCMPCVWSPSQMQCYMSISSDLWTTSSFNTLSPQQRYRHNPWPKGRLQERGHHRLKPSTPFMMELLIKNSEMAGKHTAASIWTWMFPSTHMEDARCFLVIPLPPQIASFPTLWPVSGAGPSVLSSVCCDYRGHFQ